jgi:general secretion pathway protein I
MKSRIVKLPAKLSKGFTLIEVMLAMAIFAIAGIALLSAADNNFRNLSHLENKILANWIASNQLVEISLDPKWPPKNNKKGTVEMASRDWFWTQKVIKTGDKNMRSVVIEIRLLEDEKLALTSVMTYVSKNPKKVP